MGPSSPLRFGCRGNCNTRVSLRMPKQTASNPTTMPILEVSRAKWRTFLKCSHEVRSHGCLILPRPADTEYASQERTTQHCEFSRIAAGITIFLHGGSPRTTVGQITWKYRLGKPSGYYPNTSTRCYTTTRRSNDTARSQPRRQRRHKPYHGHKDEQTS